MNLPTSPATTLRDIPASPRLPFSVSALCPFLLPLCRLHLYIHQILLPTTLHDLHYFIMFELTIAGFNYQEERVARCESEIRRIKHWVIRLRQLIKRQHSQHRGERCYQNRAFKRDWYERRPTVEWLATDIQWVVDNFHPILHEEA